MFILATSLFAVSSYVELTSLTGLMSGSSELREHFLCILPSWRSEIQSYDLVQCM